MVASRNIRLSPTPGVDWWDKQPNESPVAFARFLVFRDLPLSKRSVKAAAEIVGVRANTLGNMATSHRWRDRAAAHDAEQARIRMAAMSEQATTLAQSQMSVALRATEVLLRSIDALRVQQTILPPDLLPRWAAMIETAARMAERTADAVDHLAAEPAQEQADALRYFHGLTPDEQRRRSLEIAEGVIRLHEAGRTSA